MRGAYLASEPQRDLIWDTKEQTDKAYNTITRALLQARIEDLRMMVLPSQSHRTGRAKTDTSFSLNDIERKTFSFPDVSLLLATHNKQSVLEAQKIQAQQAQQAHESDRERGRGRGPSVEVAFAQLQGMADDISCGLVADKMKHGVDADDSSSVSDYNNTSIKKKQVYTDTRYHHPKVFKCLAWGTVEQCLSYLLRRADENKEAAGRTADTARAMMWEMWRRIKSRMGAR